MGTVLAGSRRRAGDDACLAAITGCRAFISVLTSVTAWASVLAFSAARAQPAPANSPPGRMVEVNGALIHLLCKGSGRHTVVIEAGASTPSRIWYGVQDLIAPDARVCTYDRPGYDWSPPIAPDVCIDARADMLHDLLEASGARPPYIMVGHSYGGLIVRSFARRHPAEVEGVVLVDAVEEGVVYDPSVLAFVLKDAEGLIPQAANIRQKGEILKAQRYEAAVDETRSYLLVKPEMRRPGGFGRLGDTPLAVVQHGRPFTGDAAILERHWAEGQKRLAALSSRSVVFTSDTDHNIEIRQPTMIAEAVRQVIKMIDR
ncbi:MAG TPA: alpha/beta fold hydrolase [Caulobacteraceae bacterium]|jgi:pimeloyl-ACP methyl ester carboxylesterase